MREAVAEKVSVGSQLSWVALLSPVLSVLSSIALATVVPLGNGSPIRIETADGGYSETSELGFAASLIASMVWLLVALGIIAATATFFLRSGRERSSLIRAAVGFVLAIGLVVWVLVNRP